MDWRGKGTERAPADSMDSMDSMDTWRTWDSPRGNQEHGEAEETLILPSLTRNRPQGSLSSVRLRRWQIGLAMALVMVTLTGATFLVSWAPHAGGSGDGHSSTNLATGLSSGGLAAIPPTIAPNSTARPRLTATPH